MKSKAPSRTDTKLILERIHSSSDAHDAQEDAEERQAALPRRHLGVLLLRVHGAAPGVRPDDDVRGLAGGWNLTGVVLEPCVPFYLLHLDTKSVI